VSQPLTEVPRRESPPEEADLSVEDRKLIEPTCIAYENALIAELKKSGLPASSDPFLEAVPERLRPALRTELRGVEDDWWPRLPGYETLLCLGGGGMGRVYKARRLADGEEVAFKLLLGGELDRVHRLRGLVEERLAHIDHPNLVRLHGFVEDNSRTYLVMDLVRGNDLRREHGTLALNGSGLGTAAWGDRKKRLLDLFQEIADAVVQLHHRGVMHRDLKPGNVVLDHEGHPKICDYGLARPQNESDQFPLTVGVVGTRFYMAPEQARGCSDLTLAVDIWALGAILYEFLTDLPPFVSRELLVEDHRKQTEPGPPPPSSFNVRLAHDIDLDYLCVRCLTLNPAERYSAPELAADLRRYRHGEGIAPRQSWWQWVQGVPAALKREMRDEEYHRRHRWSLLTEAVTSLVGHVGFCVLLNLAMPGQVLWAWLLVEEILGGWVNYLWKKGRRPFTPMERDVMQLWTGVAIANAILLYLHCPFWGPVEPKEAIRFYPAWAVTNGLVFFVEAHLCWSRFYFVGAAFFAAALLLPLTGLWAPVAYGLLYSAIFVWLSWQGRSEPPAPSSVTTVTYP
jgi:serine/threonine-protein kinase